MGWDLRRFEESGWVRGGPVAEQRQSLAACSGRGMGALPKARRGCASGAG